MFKSYSIVVLLVSVAVLSGCKAGDGFNVKYEKGDLASSTPVVTTPTAVPSKDTPKKKDFPVKALAILPASEVQKHRENGNSGNNETYFISIITTEEIGTCFTRRVEVKGIFEKNLSKDWSLGQSSKWDTKKTSVKVSVVEDTRMCGGALLTFSGTAVIADTSFKVDSNTKSVYFYTDILASSKDGRSKDISIAIDSTQIATGSLSGGTISSGGSTEWASNYDSNSESKFEGVNVTLNGGLYVDSLAVNGITHAKISKAVSNYTVNGTRPVDPFAQQPADGGRG